jgi:uncharacterized protein (TIGR00369 family)
MMVTPETAAQIIEQGIPLHKFINVKVIELRDGYCKMRWPFREEVIGNFIKRNWHGGMIASALDAVGGAVGMATLTSPDERLATIDLRVDYLRSTGPSDLVVTAELVRSGNRIIATDMEAWQEDEQKLVAKGRAMYSVYRTSKQD